MREKHLKQFICAHQPNTEMIPVEDYYHEAFNQRDIYREKLKVYYDNKLDKKLLPSGYPQDYVQPIMQNLQRRAGRPLSMRSDGNFKHPQPAYLVLAAWCFILYTDSKINNYFESNYREKIKDYLDHCTSMPGIRNDLNLAIHEYEAALNPSLFDVPPVAPKAPQSPLPEYGHQTIPLDARNAHINIAAHNSTIIFQGNTEKVQIHHQPKQLKRPSRAPKVPSANPYPFVVHQEKAEEIIARIKHYAEGKEGNPKLMMMPVRAAMEAGVIDGVTHAKLAEILPEYGSMDKSTFNRWIKKEEVGTHPYAGHTAFQDMLADFKKLKEE